MKLTMIQAPGGAVPAALLANGTLLDLGAAQMAAPAAGVPLRSVMQILDLSKDLMPVARRLVDRAEEGRDADRLAASGAIRDEATAIYAPILRPQLIVSCGRSYRAHAAEMGDAPPAVPAAFLKSPTSINAHRRPLVLPRQAPDMIDFECEFSCVIGRAFHDLPPEETLAHIAGFTMVNDVSSRRRVREWSAAMKGDPMECVELQNQVVLDKQFPGFCPLGPVVATADEFGDPNDVSVETRLNGEVMQSAHSSDLIFPIAYYLSYFSRWYRFEPGDVLTTGTPAGVGFARKPPRFLRSGDVVQVSSSRIGTLSNPVVHDSRETEHG